jgi:hypothetical protein
MITIPVLNSWSATMLTTAAPRRTICIRSRYWRRNAFQAGSFSPSASLLSPCSCASLLDLGRVEPGARIDAEPRRDVLGGEVVPGGVVARGLCLCRHRSHAEPPSAPTSSPW